MWNHRRNPDWEFRILASGSVATCLVSRKSINFSGLFFLTYNMKKDYGSYLQVFAFKLFITQNFKHIEKENGVMDSHV